MAGLFNGILQTVFNTLSANADSIIDWSFNGTEIEGRGRNIFFILSADSIALSNETYQASTVRYRHAEMKLKCSIFAPCDTEPSTLTDLFESEICTRLIATSLAVTSIKCSESKQNADYDRMELISELALKVLYIY